MSKSIRAIVLVVASIACGGANARDPASAIVATTKLGEQLTESHEACEASESAGDIESIAIANPSMFRGIDSRSARWRDARDAYLRYAISTCVPQNIQSYAESAASLYRDALNEAEMSAVLKFYASDAGKKFAEASLRLSSLLNKKMYEESRKVREEGAMRFESDMEKINAGSNSRLDHLSKDKDAEAVKPVPQQGP